MAIDLIAIDDLQKFLPLPSPTSQQAEQLTAIIAGINAAVPRYCGRVLALTAITEYKDANGRKILQLKEYPMASTPAPVVTYYDEAETATTVASSDYWIDSECGQLELKPSAVHGSCWIKGRHNYRVVYSAGYASTAIPADLKLACLTWAAHIWRKVEQRLYGLQSESFGDKNSSYNFDEIPKDVKEMLSRFVRQAYA